MDKTRSEGAAQLFADAAGLPPAEADAYLVHHAGGDDEVLAYARSLLRASADADRFFDDLSERLGIAAATHPRTVGSQGDQVGAYRLTEPVGSGGSGTVWRAERTDGQFEGEVAIKLLDTSTASTDALSRFGDEARVLARLTHPNIARLLDAGLDASERPYLVLEFVEGEKIDDYCNARTLGIRERIRLFIDVLQAVGHAHANLVVHRDIKPSNVMVDTAGNVKLLDFGIAKLLRPEAELPGFDVTVEVGAALTPEYASPEQLLGKGITTASDVYALGVLLYRLLTNNSPRSRESMSSYAALVDTATREPPKASSVAANAGDRRMSLHALQRELRGDLDNILHKALAPEPAGRYATAQEFAADLERYLSGEPVSAVPPTVAYRARKFVGRHRSGVATAILTSLALVAALGITVQQMLAARAERDAAEYERQRVAASNEFYGLLLEEMGTTSEPLTALALLDRGAELLQRQYDANQPFMGRIQFDLSRHYANLPERERELELLSLAEAAARKGEDDDLLAEVLCARATTTLNANTAEAATVAEEANRVLARVQTPSADTRFHCLRMHSRLAEAQGDRAAAIEMLKTARLDFVDTKLLSAHARALVLSDLGLLYYKEGRFADTLALLGETLDILEAAGRDRTLTYAKIQGSQAAAFGAVGECREAVALQERLFERFAVANWSDRRVSLALRVNYALNLVRLHRGGEAIDILMRLREDAVTTGDTVFTGFADLFLASAYVEVDDLAAADARLESARAVLSGSPGVWDHQLIHVDALRATIARKRGAYDEARGRLLPWLGQLGYPPLTETTPNLALLLNGMGRIELAAGNAAEAEQYLSDFLALREPMQRRPGSSAYVGAGLVLRAEARSAQGNVDGAIADLQRAVAALGTGLGDDNVETTEARTLLDQVRHTR